MLVIGDNYELKGMIAAKDFRFGGLLVGGITPVLVVGWVWILWTFLK